MPATAQAFKEHRSLTGTTGNAQQRPALLQHIHEVPGTNSWLRTFDGDHVHAFRGVQGAQAGVDGPVKQLALIAA